LRRRVTLHRTAPHGWVEVVDDFQFSDGPAPFESALITFHDVTVKENALFITSTRGGLRVAFDAEQVDVRIERHTEVDFEQGPIPVNRIVFAMKAPVQQGLIRLAIVPERKDIT